VGNFSSRDGAVAYTGQSHFFASRPLLKIPQPSRASCLPRTRSRGHESRQAEDGTPWILSTFIAAVFVQSLFFKFSNAFETRYIFTIIGDWLADNEAVIRQADANWTAFIQ